MKDPFHLFRKNERCILNFVFFILEGLPMTRLVTWKLVIFVKLNEVYGSMFLGNRLNKERKYKMY